MLRRLYHVARDLAFRTFPDQAFAINYYNRYRKMAQELGVPAAEHDRLFAAMVYRSAGKPSLQIGARERKLAPHWVSVDRYDTSPLIDFNYDVHDLPFPDASFDFVVCAAVLEHVEYPQKAIAELTRVLRPGGEIWIEVPMDQPYHPSPGDFWRVTHEGMRIWMKGIDEAAIGIVFMNESPIYNYVFFHGIKPSSGAAA
jgi:SAM-dependent methyltransferase